MSRIIDDKRWSGGLRSAVLTPTQRVGKDECYWDAAVAIPREDHGHKLRRPKKVTFLAVSVPKLVWCLRRF